MKQKTKYPKAAKAIAGVALFLFVLGFKAPALFVLGGFLGLVAIILALGPDNHAKIELADDDNLNPHKTGFVFENGRYVTEAEAGYSYF